MAEMYLQEATPVGPLPSYEVADVEQLRSKCRSVLDEASVLVENLEQLFVNFPALEEKLVDKGLFGPDFQGLKDTLSFAKGKIDSFNAQTLAIWVEDYNFYAQRVNEAIQSYELKEKEAKAVALTTGIDPKTYEEYEGHFTSEEKVQIRAFVAEAWATIFPPSYIDQLTLYVSSKVHGLNPLNHRLSDAQRILLAPANGVEDAVMGVASLLNPQTYTDLYHAAETVYGMSPKEWGDTLSFLQFMAEDLSTTDMVAPAISVLFGMATMFGGLSRLQKVVKSTTMPARLQSILEGPLRKSVSLAPHIQRVSAGGRLLPAGVLAGFSLRYVSI